MPQAAWIEVSAHCYPERGSLPGMPDRHYNVIMQSRPPEHAKLVELLLAGRTPLFKRNTGDLKWKRFLFGELGLNGSANGPDCSRCSKFPVCFPAANPSAS